MAHLPYLFCKNNGVACTEVADDYVSIAHLDMLSPQVLVELRRYFQKPLRLQAVSSTELDALLSKTHSAGKNAAMDAVSGLEESMDLQELMRLMPATEDLLEREDDAPVIRLINALLMQAIKRKASDIHFETFEDKLKVRFRLDGVLQEVLEPPRVLSPLLISRLKIMAKLDIAERRLPQDGRISIRLAGHLIDLRVSTIPTHHGERIVLRLLDKQSAPLDLLQLGMSQEILSEVRELIQQPHGIILVTGPTGSGKTTTLYAAISELNDEQRNILTVEDPIEYYLPGIGQTQVNTKVNMTFARGLRAILRQDPDVILVGEIRDKETADMAIQASLTGHLVLSTLHTNSAIGAITRLRDMGVEPFLLSSTIIGIAAQRLVRTLCFHCRKARKPSESERLMLGIDKHNDSQMIYTAEQCDECNQTGYKGRTGIYELIVIDSVLEIQIHDSANEVDLEKEARQHSKSMREDGWRKVLEGQTTIDEVLRVTSE